MTRRRILTDRHQADLLHSLQLLFEDRLGLELYVPVGEQWWQEGIWRFGAVFGDDRLARQYLPLDGRYQDAGDHHVTFDPHHPSRPIRAVTLEQARAARGEWAVVMPTVQENQAGYHRFAGEVGATYAYQVGNNNQRIDWELDPVAIVSSNAAIEGRGVHCLQEFDTRHMFGFREPDETAERTLISSFVNCMPMIHPNWETLEGYRARLSEFRFRVHGIAGPDGNLETAGEIAEAMSASGFGWHDKPQGDGFGHVIFGWAAIGRPVIGHAHHYTSCLAKAFWEDGVTCVDLGARSEDENTAVIRAIAGSPDRHQEMCYAIRQKLDLLVDPARDAQRVKEALAL